MVLGRVYEDSRPYKGTTGSTLEAGVHVGDCSPYHAVIVKELSSL